jgi:1,4-alpha-glucan branching enzyme
MPHSSALQLLTVHPTELYACWRITDSLQRMVERHYGCHRQHANASLRLYRLLDNGEAQLEAQLDGLNLSSSSTYIPNLHPFSQYVADFGIVLDSSGKEPGPFISLFRSAPAQTALDEIHGENAAPSSMKDHAAVTNISAVYMKQSIPDDAKHFCGYSLYPIEPNGYYSAASTDPVINDAAAEYPLLLQPNKDHRENISQKPLRILMLTWEYPPHMVGGLGRAVYDLSRSLAGLGHTVHVLTCQSSGGATDAYHPSKPSDHLQERVWMNGVSVHRVSIPAAFEPNSFWDWVLQMNMRMYEYMVNNLKLEAPFDLIHAHDWLVYQASIESKRLFGIPLVATIHATEYGRHLGRLPISGTPQLIHRQERMLAHGADRIIACSRSMSDEIARTLELPIERITVIPNGTDVDDRASTKSAAADSSAKHTASNGESGGRTLLFIGRLVYEKGVQVLIDAMPAILKVHPQAQLIIAGAGPMREQLEQQAKRIVSSVRFVGFLDDTEKRQVFEQADVVVMPSLYEPFGLVALEAMQAGRPIVASCIGGLREMIQNGVTGYLVPPNDHEQLSKQILHIFQHPIGSAMVSEQAQRFVQADCKNVNMAHATVNLYDSIL